ncbi:MAG TPA: ATP synthase F1 subunit gamma [Candidatus Saccharimonadales bacterium]|nr:ATP synthase F1 subunit gamma [Candidatus Saccharimonadales bacterium]
MASVQQIKRRIGSVKNTRQITKAMQLVAASKLRRAQEAAEKPREYTAAARALLARLKQLSEPNAHGFFNERAIKHRTLVVISGDRGLAGAYNANVCKRLVEELRADAAAGVQTSLLLIGRQVAQFAVRLESADILGVYQDVAETSHRNELRAIITTAFDNFHSQKTDAVDVIFTHYRSTVSQEVTVQRLLPAGNIDEQSEVAVADFEPSAEAVLETTVVRLVEAQVFQAVLDGFASEHSMRMLAMKNATDNASDLADDLTLVYNNARQASITQELAEITGGAEALK